jgi:hypothetical protein
LDVHGKQKGNSFFITLLEIQQFIDENPKEFIYIEISEGKDSPLTEIQRNLLKEVIVFLFSTKLINESDCKTWFNIKTVTMGDIWQNQKQVLMFLSPKLIKDRFISCEKLTKKNQKLQNYQIKKTENSKLGMHLKNDFIKDISVKTTDRKELFFKNMNKLDLPKSVLLLVENQFLIKGRMKKNELYNSFKNFIKNTIKGTTELCHELLKNDEIIDLLLKFCKKKSLNIGKENTSSIK